MPNTQPPIDVDDLEYLDDGKELSQLKKLFFDVWDGEALNFQPLAEESLKIGRQWIFREVFTLEADETIEFAITNPLQEFELRTINRTIDPDEEILGTVTVNPDFDDTQTFENFRFITTRVEDPQIPGPDFNVTYNGTYTLDADAQAIPIRSAGGGDPPGPATAGSRQVPAAFYRIEPGAGVHYSITSEVNDNTITVEFVIGQREETNL
jgi:hypothetical protein